jgi:hypothetical protein
MHHASVCKYNENFNCDMYHIIIYRRGRDPHLSKDVGELEKSKGGQIINTVSQGGWFAGYLV